MVVRNAFHKALSQMYMLKIWCHNVEWGKAMMWFIIAALLDHTPEAVTERNYENKVGKNYF